MTTTHRLRCAARRRLAAFWADRRGATAVEYALVASGIAAVIAVAVAALGDTVKALFTAVLNLFQ